MAPSGLYARLRHTFLVYGEKIVKIGPVYPEIFDKIHRTT